MRISDCSSDVCSSDLLVPLYMAGRDVGTQLDAHAAAARQVEIPDILGIDRHRGRRQPGCGVEAELLGGLLRAHGRLLLLHLLSIAAAAALGQGSAARQSVVYGKSVSVRVDLGGRRIIKKKNLIQTK